MTDNVNITPGAGRVIAADDISSVYYQRIKLSLGADGEAADLDSGQQTMANSVPVVIASDQVAVATKDAGPSWTGSFSHTTSSDMSGGVDVTVAPTAGQKIVIVDVFVSVSTAMTMKLTEETSGSEVGRYFLSTNGNLQVTPRGKWKLYAADKKLRATASTSGSAAVDVWYYSEA